MKGSTRQIPGASFIWSCFVQNRAFILCPLKCDFRPLDIAWQPCVRLPRNIATRSRFYSRRSANTYPSLESDHKNDPYHGKTGQHALTSNKIFFSKSPVFAVHRGIVRHLPAEHKIQSLPVRIPPSPPKETLKPQWFQGFSPLCFPYFSPCGRQNGTKGYSAPACWPGRFHFTGRSLPELADDRHLAAVDLSQPQRRRDHGLQRGLRLKQRT